MHGQRYKKVAIVGRYSRRSDQVEGDPANAVFVGIPVYNAAETLAMYERLVAPWRRSL